MKQPHYVPPRKPDLLETLNRLDELFILMDKFYNTRDKKGSHTPLGKTCEKAITKIRKEIKEIEHEIDQIGD